MSESTTTARVSEPSQAGANSANAVEATRTPTRFHIFSPLSPLPEPVCATNPTQIRSNSVALEITGAGTGFKIACASTGEVFFRVERKIWAKKLILWDSTGNPFITMKLERSFWRLYSWVWIVFAGESSEEDEPLFKIKVSSWMSETTATVDFLNGSPGQELHLALKWITYEFGVIFKGDPELDGTPVAKFYQPHPKATHSLLTLPAKYLEIAANMDIALAVAMSIAVQ